MEKNDKKVIKIRFNTFLAIAASFVVILFVGIGFLASKANEKNKIEPLKVVDTDTRQTFKYALKSNSLEEFDLRFLQLENEKKNKVYSPLSIKYTLAMLNEGTEGESKEQISNLIGEYKPNKYINNKNMSLANALFIRSSYKEYVKENFITSLRSKYNANVEYDSFKSADKINSWISDKTLGLIEDMINDADVNELNFALVNALAIDMEWNEKFLERNYAEAYYSHEKYYWKAPDNLLSNKFEGVENEISGMGIIASINNYDIVNTLGEENIRKTVGDALRKYLKEDPDGYAEYYLEGKDDIETAINDYLDEYITQINSNYKRVDNNTEFYIYEDESVKAFAKDLKEYNGKTLQYVAIMPENLEKYIDNINVADVNKIIYNLKELKSENFKEGVVTQIVGYIPKFKFDYDLHIIKDLNDMGVKDVFDKDKANLKGITDEQAYISQAMHKANIEFTQDGIKASAATFVGGAGAGEMFDYYYDVPVETIDLTFDNPYMFIIRDKETGEVWFAGTVYEPLSIDDESEKDIISYSEFLKRSEIIGAEEDIEKEEDTISNEVTEIRDGADAMPEMLKYRNEEYMANYYYRLNALRDNKDGTYTATVDFYSPVYITEEKYNNMVDDGKIELNGVSYAFSKMDSEFNEGYGFIMSNDGQPYCVEKQGDKYAFYREIGGVKTIINSKDDSFEIILDEDTNVGVMFSENDYKLKDYASELTSEFINNSMITFGYSEEDKGLSMGIDPR